jgi:UPF0755 protein
MMAKKGKKKKVTYKGSYLHNDFSVFGSSFFRKVKIALGVFLFLFFVYILFFVPNTNFKETKYDLYIRSAAPIDEIINSLSDSNVTLANFTLKMLSAIYGPDTVHSGLYEIGRLSGNLEILNQFSRSPRPSVDVIIPSYQLRKNVLKTVCRNTDIKFTALEEALADEEFIVTLDDFDKESVYCIFIPDTIQAYKDCNARELAERIYRHYSRFWNKHRLKKAEENGLSPIEASILASIVYAETKKVDEMPTIAGLYINRLNKGMKLQSDPTLVFANGNPHLKRVWNKHKKVKSKYNTYRYHGLPPGPIFTPPAYVIDAVLEYEDHDYLFFSAKKDLSGYHEFARTYEEHLQNARSYQSELNRRGIK